MEAFRRLYSWEGAKRTSHINTVILVRGNYSRIKAEPLLAKIALVSATNAMFQPLSSALMLGFWSFNVLSLQLLLLKVVL